MLKIAFFDKFLLVILMKKTTVFYTKNAAFRREKVNNFNLAKRYIFYPKNDDFFLEKTKNPPRKFGGFSIDFSLNFAYGNGLTIVVQTDIFLFGWIG